MAKLRKIAELVKTVKKAERNKVLRDELTKYSSFASFPTKFHLPINPRVVCSGFVVEKCRCMDSNTVSRWSPPWRDRFFSLTYTHTQAPLWLELQNKDNVGAPYLVIFKEGDDLRQVSISTRYPCSISSTPEHSCKLTYLWMIRMYWHCKCLISWTRFLRHLFVCCQMW